MEKIKEKVIAIQTNLNINLLGNLVIQLSTNPQKTISEFIKDWQVSIKWDQEINFSIVNQDVILTHLYGLIVYPKETFHNDIPNKRLKDVNKTMWGNFIFQSLPQKEIKILGEKKIFIDENELTLEFLIRKIRNSLSHASVEIFENNDFVFSDNDDSTKIHFTIQGLQTFTQKFMSCYLSQKWE